MPKKRPHSLNVQRLKIDSDPADQICINKTESKERWKCIVYGLYSDNNINGPKCRTLYRLFG